VSIFFRTMHLPRPMLARLPLRHTAAVWVTAREVSFSVRLSRQFRPQCISSPLCFPHQAVRFIPGPIAGAYRRPTQATHPLSTSATADQPPPSSSSSNASSQGRATGNPPDNPPPPPLTSMWAKIKDHLSHMSNLGVFVVIISVFFVVATVLFIIFDAIEEIVVVLIFGAMAAVAGAYAMVAVGLIKIMNWLTGRKPHKDHPDHQVSRPSPSRRAAIRAKAEADEAATATATATSVTRTAKPEVSESAEHSPGSAIPAVSPDASHRSVTSHSTPNLFDHRTENPNDSATDAAPARA